METILIVHAAATWFMAGVIWFVQIVHYPLMARVGADAFSGYERSHARLTTWIVAPAMLVEAVTATLLVAPRSPAVPASMAWLGLILIAVIWLSTALLQVPQHRLLETGFNIAAHRRLVRTNWIRTFTWSLRAILVAGWILAG